MIKKISLLLFIAACITPIKASENLFPVVDGWKMKMNERVYNSGDLWELINGAADIFLSYHFEDLHIAEYTKKNQMIRVEIYKHRTTDDAYGIYTAERMPDYAQVQIGAQGYKSQGVLNFLAGIYYVKIMSAGVVEADEQTIAMVAQKVEARLDQPKALPAKLQYLPEEGRIYLSDTYIAQNFMGYSFLQQAFTAKYSRPADLQLFVIQTSAEEIDKMLGQYLQLMKEDKVIQKDNLYIVHDLFNGTVFLKKNKDYLVGVLNTSNEAIAREMISKTEANVK